ncbi:type 1 glutamine amidotransferase-like domain-containing protein [Bacillaceae bacterium SIJ1]|uniref:Type 1 glutamine amidotransferase-like domain-containing protein n=1 Tax=Litoribacterium kuwaitense TaxID=1398745 RepID=UPI0013E9BF25|nr:Type 1 glutamine amidotransferase-like domain-containing protein [Litoribacterium kuwaitense]NGP46458.1 type 1 glutamine amidotransferase-like domain-containing protein [Litoribacterium kuwaitense]
MNNKHLFLFGGSPPFCKHLGKTYSELSLREKGKVAVLFVSREGWEQYMPRYTNELEKNGIGNFVYIPLTEHSLATYADQLNSCTGIIIGGGDTELYRKYIVDTTLGAQVKRMYEKGIPIAGFSAGALISPENCVIPPIDNAQGKHLFLKGLGLIKDCVICVHFSKWNEEENLKTAMTHLSVSKGYGIDDEEGLYFVNETLVDSEGENYHFIQRSKR